MKLIKTALLCSSIAFSYNALAQSVDLQTLNKSLKPWQPAEIVQTSNSIKITLPANTVSSEAYEALISSGVCTPIWLKDALHLSSKQRQRYMSLISFPHWLHI
jgi:hypothetical protein